MRDERVILVTGGVRRVGKVISDGLCRAGFCVAAHSRTEGPFIGDLTNAASVHALFEAVVSKCGRIDGIVNNAALFGDFSAERFASVNVTAPVLLSELLLQHVRTQGRSAAVVNLLDCRIAGSFNDPYTRSKKDLAAFTVREAVRFAPEVRLCGVAPGAVLKPETVSEQAGPRLLAEHPDPQAVAEAVLFLLQAKFVTGQILYVDSGQHLMDLPNG